jgi:hypothetical protein
MFHFRKISVDRKYVSLYCSSRATDMALKLSPEMTTPQIVRNTVAKALQVAPSSHTK